MSKKIKQVIHALDHDESGAIPVGHIFLIAAVAIPVVIALTLFAGEVQEWLVKKSEELPETSVKWG